MELDVAEPLNRPVPDSRRFPLLSCLERCSYHHRQRRHNRTKPRNFWQAWTSKYKFGNILCSRLLTFLEISSGGNYAKGWVCSTSLSPFPHLRVGTEPARTLPFSPSSSFVISSIGTDQNVASSFNTVVKETSQPLG